MNFRVDLILPTERRSASVINAKSLTRIGMVVLPVILLVLIAMGVVNMMQTRSELADLENKWKDAEPKKKAAAALKQDLADNAELDKRIAGWQKSRFDTADHLRHLQSAFKPEFTLQLSKLVLSSSMTLKDGQFPARSYESLMLGTAFGDGAERHVQNLRRSLDEYVATTNVIENVEVARFTSDNKPGANKLDRIFQLNLSYSPRTFQ